MGYGKHNMQRLLLSPYAEVEKKDKERTYSAVAVTPTVILLLYRTGYKEAIVKKVCDTRNPMNDYLG